jgi:hypothetical protein
VHVDRLILQLVRAGWSVEIEVVCKSDESVVFYYRKNGSLTPHIYSLLLRRLSSEDDASRSPCPVIRHKRKL